MNSLTGTTDKQAMKRYLPNVKFPFRAPALAVAIFGTVASAQADYAPPPSWMPMKMLNVSLDANNNVSVETTADIYRLNPAPGTYQAATHTYDLSVVSFDPAQAWSVLNGTAYSRVLGWYDRGVGGTGGDDFYATYAAQLAGHSLWIERIGGSPELKTYFVDEASSWNMTANGPYTPIFGTDGSPTQWRWDGFMDHNANAVALTDITAPNQLFTANYHLYVGDQLGNAVAGYGDTTTTWTWRGPEMAVVPEPAVSAFLAAGLGGWTLCRRFRPKQTGRAAGPPPR
jgi:hypothetical protein